MGNGGSKHQDGEIGLWNFEMQKVVGKGAFGKVRIVQKKDASKQLFALKYIDKMQCIRMHAIQNIFRERAILQDLSHPFIVNLNYAFQDDQNLFFVLDLKTGGDLRHHLSNQLGFSEGAVKVWAVELALAVQYLHNQGIVHRDIKPDNVLLDEKGHAHLTDFNIAVNIDRNSILKSRSGTMAYLAPEVFGENGYYWQVDWWSLGVMLFELIYFKRPFRGKTTSAMISSIRDSEIVFPKTNVFSRSLPVDISAECISFLTELLNRCPLDRLGCRQRQLLDVKDHVWVAGIDWNAVERKEWPSGFIPDPEDDNFDPRINLEEFLLDGFPIEAAPRQKKKKKSSGKRTKATTSSSPNAGSFLGYFSPGNTSENRKKSAADAAAVAGNMQAMLKQYKSSQHPINAAGFSLFGKKQQKNQQNQQHEKLTESERIELELRFMNDHFLPYDSSKRVPAAHTGTAPPVPPIPSPEVLKQLSANGTPLIGGEPPSNQLISLAAEASSPYQHNIFSRNETPMDHFLRSNTSINDYRMDLDGLNSSLIQSSSFDNDSSLSKSSPSNQLSQPIRDHPTHSKKSITSLSNLFKRKTAVSASNVSPTANNTKNNKASLYPLEISTTSSSTTGDDEESSENSFRMFTYRNSTASPLAIQAKYDDSIKRMDSPGILSIGNGAGSGRGRGSPAVSTTGVGSTTARKTFRVTTVPLPDDDLMESDVEGSVGPAVRAVEE
ncbi:kinase-like domain-containing protein [Obelidium mucronatum]|nr:kinase-like domain-containing protein [Obelidium mucronatum]